MNVSPLLADAVTTTPNWALRKLKPKELLHWNVHGISHADDEILTRDAARMASMSVKEFNRLYVDMIERCRREAMRFERTIFDCLIRISYERQAGALKSR